MHERPQHHGDDRVAHDTPRQRHLHALEQMRAVVEAEQRLDGDRHADERQHHERGHALHHADGRQRASAPMGLCAPYMFSRLFSTKLTAAMPACTAKLARPSDRIRRTVSPCSGIMRRRRRMGTPFVRQKYHSTVRTRWPGRTRWQARCHNAHAHDQHEQRIERGACNGADDHGAQRAVRGAGGADEVVHAHADALEDEAQADDADELHGVVPVLGSAPDTLSSHQCKQGRT